VPAKNLTNDALRKKFSIYRLYVMEENTRSVPGKALEEYKERRDELQGELTRRLILKNKNKIIACLTVCTRCGISSKEERVGCSCKCHKLIYIKDGVVSVMSSRRV